MVPKKLMEIFETCKDGGIEQDCVINMSRVDDEKALKQVFHDGVIESKIRAQDLYFLFAATDLATIQQDVIWDFFKSNMSAIIDRFGGRFENLVCSRIFSYSTSFQSTEEYALELEQFFNSLPDGIQTAWRTTYKQSLERVRLNEKLYKNQFESVAEFLETN